MVALSKLREFVGRRLGRGSRHERFLRRLEFPADQVARTYQLLASAGVQAWVVGGWGVDVAAGRQTRSHRDLDFLVPIDQGDHARRVLEGHGFEVYLPETHFPYRVGMVNAKARLMVDLQLVTPQPDGSCTFWIIDGQEDVPSYDYTYSAEGLGGVGAVAGTEVPCITLEEQVRARTEQDYSFEHPDRVRAGGILADVHDLAVAKSQLNS